MKSFWKSFIRIQNGVRIEEVFQLLHGANGGIRSAVVHVRILHETQSMLSAYAPLVTADQLVEIRLNRPLQLLTELTRSDVEMQVTCAGQFEVNV